MHACQKNLLSYFNTTYTYIIETILIWKHDSEENEVNLHGAC